MKAFFIILLLFSAILFAIGANYLYVSHLSQELIDTLEAIPSPAHVKKTGQIKEIWEDNKEIIQITVNHSEIDTISNTVTELCVFAETQNVAEFERARRILIDTFKSLKESEKLSPTNIL